MSITDLRNIYYQGIKAGFGLESYNSNTNIVHVFFRTNYQLSDAQASKFFCDLDALHKDFPFVPYSMLSFVAGYLVISADNDS